MRDLSGFQDLLLLWWIGALFIDSREICELRLHKVMQLALLYERKQNWKKQHVAKPDKMAMNWTQYTQKKQQQTQVYVSEIYFYIYA